MDIGPRRFSGIKSAGPEFIAYPELYSVWSQTFEGLALLSGCLAFPGTETEVADGDPTK